MAIVVKYIHNTYIDVKYMYISERVCTMYLKWRHYNTKDDVHLYID